MIASPYLLYLGHSNDFIGLKTSRGLAVFRPDDCVGEFRYDDCKETVGLPRMGFAEAAAAGARTLVLGVANAGGLMNEEMVADALAALAAGLDIASGLHHLLRDEPRLVAAARAHGRTLHDVRVPRPDIPVGKGQKRSGHRLLTIGTDCSVGKMYTTLLLERAMRARGFKADFRATGQTGILIAGDGVPLDAVVADFMAGAVEQLSPARDDDGWDVIEGQGSLLHPSFAGVSLALLHGAQPDVLILCHEPGRPHMRGLPHYPVPGLRETLDLNLALARRTNPAVQVGGVALNTSRLSPDEADRICKETADTLGLPCSDPFSMGVEPMIDWIERCFRPSSPGGKPSR